MFLQKDGTHLTIKNTQNQQDIHHHEDFKSHIRLHFYEMQQATLITSECNSSKFYVKLHFPLTMVRSGGIDLQLLDFY